MPPVHNHRIWNSGKNIDDISASNRLNSGRDQFIYNSQIKSVVGEG